jgi:hypothetical protein
MTHPIVSAAIQFAAGAHTTHIGPWIIVPILILLALIVTPIYVIRDRRRRRDVSGRQ